MNERELSEVELWFAERGLRLRVSDIDYADRVGKAPSRHHHVWVDLLTEDGRLMQGGYGSGTTLDAAMSRARERYLQEEEGGPPPGPRVLP